MLVSQVVVKLTFLSGDVRQADHVPVRFAAGDLPDEVRNLPEKLREAAQLRENNPAATLSELAALADPPVSKPAMSHRLRSIIERSGQSQGTRGARGVCWRDPAAPS